MEIIHLVLGKANPQRMNGVNKVVYEMATRQADKGFSVQVWGIAKDTTHNYPNRNFITKIFKAQRNPFSLHQQLKQAIAAKSVNTVFHLHGGFIPTFYAASQWLKRNNIPFITMTHGAYNTIAMQKSYYLKKLYFNLFETKLLAAASFIHCIGSSEVVGLNKIFPNNKTVLIPYGFDMPITKTIEPDDSSKFIIGFCGRLDVFTKGLNELVDGFQLFLQHNSNAQLWLIGDSKEKAALQERVQLAGIENKVVFYGSKYGDEKLHLLQQCTVFAAPSRNEGLPAAVLEAAALGLPCLVTEATNTGLAINQYKAGVVIKATDAIEIAEGLKSLSTTMQNEKNKVAMKLNAKNMIVEYFNWNNTLNELETVYKKALAK
ncbi:MAG: glycosyltransferase [Chitinophagaceae bacterium]|jgi:glycosyltransferase involved in cell wall biosynthesis|nr:glycosyltransferase [Chitinophagaceae bacterium]